MDRRNTIALPPEEERLCLDARNAAHQIKRTFENWVTIGRAVVALRKRADIMGGRRAFQRLLEEQGLAPLVDRSRASRLIKIMANLPAVVEWQQGLKPKQQLAWASPDTICRQCPALQDEDTKPRARAQPPSGRASLAAENEQLKARIAELEEERQDFDKCSAGTGMGVHRPSSGFVVPGQFDITIDARIAAATQAAIDAVCKFPIKRDKTGVASDYAERKMIAMAMLALVRLGGISTLDLRKVEDELNPPIPLSIPGISLGKPTREPAACALSR
jgi:hypothetical protein